MRRITKGDLQEKARWNGIDPDQSYDELREAVEIHECKNCGDEYLHDLWEGFCTDGCQVEYMNKYY